MPAQRNKKHKTSGCTRESCGSQLTKKVPKKYTLKTPTLISNTANLHGRHQLSSIKGLKWSIVGFKLKRLFFGQCSWLNIQTMFSSHTISSPALQGAPHLAQRNTMCTFTLTSNWTSVKTAVTLAINQHGRNAAALATSTAPNLSFLLLPLLLLLLLLLLPHSQLTD